MMTSFRRIAIKLTASFVTILLTGWATNAAGQSLINIDFAAYPGSVGVGAAATGQSASDYWNPYLAPFSNLAAVPNLKYADGSVSGAGLTVANGPGHWGNGTSNAMYATYDYNQGQNITITLTNLLA
ncbi:MAG: Immunoglobulin I-set domain protein, partial [Pedosphaera sp.]|nr:Immunoglobulin I-set domain protein [Pedosphaera sp.]